jgi:hypothetical protein
MTADRREVPRALFDLARNDSMAYMHLQMWMYGNPAAPTYESMLVGLVCDLAAENAKLKDDLAKYGDLRGLTS